jgi:hypothetical protein
MHIIHIYQGLKELEYFIQKKIYIYIGTFAYAGQFKGSGRIYYFR